MLLTTAHMHTALQPPPLNRATCLLLNDPTSQTDSHESALARGRSAIAALVEQLRITPHHEVTEAAHRLYRLAMQRGFTRGRRVDQVGVTA